MASDEDIDKSDARPAAGGAGAYQDIQELVAELRDANQNLLISAIEAQARREQAEAANRRQNEFLSMLAHELRNPLAPISMAAALLERISSAHPDLPRLQSVIQRQVEQMARLLDDLLDAARISSGRVVLKKKIMTLADVLERAVETVQPKMHQRQQQLVLDLPSRPVVLEGDAARLAQVFSNLLWNASKFTPEHGRITLSAAVEGDLLRVCVEDSGIGIGPELLPQIFELFTQGPRELARSEGGLGIGLTVVRSLVTMHGGSVEAYSEGDGKGSRFSVLLPVRHEDDVPAEVPCGIAAAGLRVNVLLIEDSADANAMLRDLLTLEGHKVACAYDGVQGLEMALSGSYQVVICDIGLPGIDGYELARRLRAQYVGAPLCLIGLSGYGGPQDRIDAVQAGFDHYLVKPVDAAALLGLIALP